MEELVLTIEKLNVQYGLKTVIDIDKLMVYQNERIGIVGDNGSGKSTLLNSIMNEDYLGKGNISKQIEFAYFEQIKSEKNNVELKNNKMFSKLGVPNKAYVKMSGGEQAKYRLAVILSEYHEGLILDEPTTHLDERSINFLIEELRYYYGTILLVSHDRYFLNELATKIWEVSNGKITEYSGNYDAYKKQKELKEVTNQKSHHHFEIEKKRLERAVREKEKQVQKLTNTKKKKRDKPSRLSGTKQKDTVQKSIQKNVTTLKKRLSSLEQVSLESKRRTVCFPIYQFQELYNDYPIRGENLTITRGKCLLENSNFQFKKGEKIAVTGDNGVGKTSFLNAILKQEKGIIISSKSMISTYNQLSYQENNEQNVLTYLLNQSLYEEKDVRSILNRMGFSQEELKTPFNKLSGGERTRVSLALTLLRPSNILILDEPTNFIDLRTIEALEDLITSYPGTVIFVSHDRYFMERVANRIFLIQNKKLIQIK